MRKRQAVFSIYITEEEINLKNSFADNHYKFIKRNNDLRSVRNILSYFKKTTFKSKKNENHIKVLIEVVYQFTIIHLCVLHKQTYQLV
jgi:hypothetical protein